MDTLLLIFGWMVGWFRSTGEPMRRLAVRADGTVRTATLREHERAARLRRVDQKRLARDDGSPEAASSRILRMVRWFGCVLVFVLACVRRRS